MTVAELINELKCYPQDMTVLISDADTDWSLPVHIGPFGPYAVKQIGMLEAIYIYGNYSEAIK